MNDVQKGDLILYQSDNGEMKIEVRLIDEMIWLSLNQMANIFDRDKSVISKHISNIFEEGELDPNRTVAKIATVQREGSREIERLIEYYNLEMIIAVGYRVKSVKNAFIKKSETFINLLLITILKVKKLWSFLRLSKTNSTLQFLGRQRRTDC